MEIYTYDFEVFPNWWCGVFHETGSADVEPVVFTSDDGNDELKKWYEAVQPLLIGYNCEHYDKYILKAVLDGKNVLQIKKINDKIINGERVDWCNIPQFDVMSADKFKGLKTLEMFMGDDIEETSVPFNKRKLTDADKENIIKYCTWDVLETEKVFFIRENEFKSQIELIRLYGLDFDECISKTKAQLVAKILGCTRGKYNDAHDIQIINSINCGSYGWMIPTFKQYLSEDRTLDLLIADIPHKLGKGGLHGCIPKYYHSKSDSDKMILHVDVNSYYPRLMIFHDLLSRNASEDGKKRFKEAHDLRIKYKSEGNKKAQAPLKIVLNSAYGITGYIGSDAYDLKRCREVCINGQLMLIDLIDKLEVIKSFKLVQSNTDGLIIEINRSDYDLVREVCNEWCTRNKMTLGYDDIEEIWQKDVNNYIIKMTDGSIETKGADVKFNNELDNDVAIKNIAIREYLINGVPVRETVEGLVDHPEYFMRNVKRSSKYDWLWIDGKRSDNKYHRIFAVKRDGHEVFKQKKNGNPQHYADTSKCSLSFNGNMSDFNLELDTGWYIDYINRKLEKWK